MTGEFNISGKLRWQDSVKINDEVKKVGWYMVNEPKVLWDAIHTKGSKLSLTRDVYGVLKEKIAIEHPEEVKRIERKRRLVASKRKFRKQEGKFMWIGKSEPVIKST